MPFLALALTAVATTTQRIEPVLWLDPRGTLRVNGVPTRGRLSPGTGTVNTPVGQGLDLTGRRSGLLLDDRAELDVAGSLTISTWVYLRRHTANGYQSQILFRGDDRDAFDSYSLDIQANGTVQFRRDGTDGTPVAIESEIPLKRWTHVTASYDGETGEMRLYRGDRLVATRTTDRRQFARLDRGQTPGVGIGNIQNERGRHNQPLDGIIADLRLYNVALELAAAGYRSGPDRLTP